MKAKASLYKHADSPELQMVYRKFAHSTLSGLWCIPSRTESVECANFSKDSLFKNIFDFTTAGDRDCVAAVERLPVLHYSVDFIFLSFGIMDSWIPLWNFETIRGSLIRHK